jgi:hypothetical protein
MTGAGCVGARGVITRDAVASSRSADGALKLRPANRMAATIKIVFADFIASPFKSLGT